MSDEAKGTKPTSVLVRFDTEVEWTDEEIKQCIEYMALAYPGVQITVLEVTPADDEPKEAAP